MNPPAVAAPMAATSTTPELPMTFVIVTFAVAVAVGLLILYLGLDHLIGTAIP